MGIDGTDQAALADGSGRVGAENVDYGGVRNVLAALRPRLARIALMTSIGVTNRDGDYNRQTEAHDSKRRSERLVRASGLPYTIVRPGWFDYNGPDQRRLVLLQGDTRHTGTPKDGVVATPDCGSAGANLTSEAARNKTFELVAEKGDAPHDWDRLFAAVEADAAGALDGVRDKANMPLAGEPQGVLDDLEAHAGTHVSCLPERCRGEKMPP